MDPSNAPFHVPESSPSAHDMSSAITAPPSLADLESDPRVYYDKGSGRPRFTDDDDLEWELDIDTRRWCPVISQDIAEQQSAAYQSQSASGLNVVPASLKRKLIKATPSPDKKRPKPNTSIYMSNLPHDVTMVELNDVCSKYGIIMDDLSTGIPKIKIYKDAHDRPKGDALVTYFKEESVALAVQLLDDSLLRSDLPEHESANPRVRVSAATFKEKSAEDRKRAVASKLALDKRTLHRKMHRFDKKLDWDEGGPNLKKMDKFAKIVVLKHMFSMDELKTDPTLLLDITEDVRGECEKVGEVTSLTLYDAEVDGVVIVRFKDPLSALACIQLMNGRFFGGSRVSASIYDGHRYKRSKKSDADDEARLQAYEKWLETGCDESTNANPSVPESLQTSESCDDRP